MRAIGRRLKLSNDELERIVWLAAERNALDEAPRLRLSRLKRLLAHPYSADLRNLLQARVAAEAGSTASIEFVDRFAAETPHEKINPPPLITGADLIAQGLTPGKSFEQILNSVRDAQLEGDITTPEEALSLAARIAADVGSE